MSDDQHSAEELAAMDRIREHLRKRGYRPALEGETPDDYLPIQGRDGQLFRLPVKRMD